MFSSLWLVLAGFCGTSEGQVLTGNSLLSLLTLPTRGGKGGGCVCWWGWELTVLVNRHSYGKAAKTAGWHSDPWQFVPVLDGVWQKWGLPVLGQGGWGVGVGGTGSGKATVHDLSFWLAAAGTIRSVHLHVIMYNNSNEYLECLIHTGPKRLHILYK